MTLQELKQHLRKLADGNQSKLAEDLRISRPYLSDVLRGYRKPGPKLLRQLGFKKVESYEKI